MGFSFAEEKERREKLPNCKTVEEVEALRCCECSKDGHFGWCDAPWIQCDFKDKIKELKGEKGHRFNNLVEQFPQLAHM